MAKHNLYDETPSMKRGEDGKMAVKKSEKKTDQKEGKKEHESASSGLPAHVMHAHERQSMHARHEMEHGAHDSGKGGDKKEMHGRHQAEMKAMHTRHEKSSGATEGSKDVGAPIEKIEKGAK